MRESLRREKTRRKKRSTAAKNTAETRSRRRHCLGLHFDEGRFRYFIYKWNKKKKRIKEEKERAEAKQARLRPGGKERKIEIKGNWESLVCTY
ncbi:hypothetical protein ACSBR2_012327 [Camellia fascicularis]